MEFDQGRLECAPSSDHSGRWSVPHPHGDSPRTGVKQHGTTQGSSARSEDILQSFSLSGDNPLPPSRPLNPPVSGGSERSPHPASQRGS